MMQIGNDEKDNDEDYNEEYENYDNVQLYFQ